MDAFGHTNADASVQLVAKLTDGRALPPWMSFDSAKGTFVGEAPPDFKGSLAVVVSARDNTGHEVSTTFRIQIGGGGNAIKEGQPPPAQPRGNDGGEGKPNGAAKAVNLGLHQRDKPVGKLAFTQQLKMASRNAAVRYG